MITRRWSHEGGRPPCPAGPYPRQARWGRLARLLSCVIAHRRETGTGCSACALAVPTLGHKPPQPRHSDGTLILARIGPSLAAARTCQSWRTVARARGGRLKGGQMVRHQPATRADASLRHPAPALPASCGKADKPTRQTCTHHARNHRWQQPKWGVPVCLQLCGWRPRLYRTRYLPRAPPVPPTRQVVGPRYPGRPSKSRVLTSTALIPAPVSIPPWPPTMRGQHWIADPVLFVDLLGHPRHAEAVHLTQRWDLERAFALLITDA